MGYNIRVLFYMLNFYNQQNNNHDGDIAPPVSSKPVHSDFTKYEDVSGEFTTGEFKWSMWYVKHKILLYKIVVRSLIGLSVIFFGYSIIAFGDYLIFGISSDTTLGNQLSVFPNYAPIQPKYAPAQLQVQGVNVLAGGSDSYDLVAQTTNSNKNFIVYFDYYFDMGGQKTDVQHGFLLAGESRPLVFFGVKGGYPGAANLVLENLNWQRIKAQDIPVPAAYQNNRLNFVVSGFNFTSQASVAGLGANIVKFSLKNDSAFDYRDAQFVVGLMQNGALSAVMPLLLQDFKNGETRTVDLRNFVANLPVDNVQVYPLIDIYNKDVYLAPQ